MGEQSERKRDASVCKRRPQAYALPPVSSQGGTICAVGGGGDSEAHYGQTVSLWWQHRQHRQLGKVEVHYGRSLMSVELVPSRRWQGWWWSGTQ